ncbi:MAG: ThiF family adenylyltransferase [Candidatus Thorarchaeota archaeon]
MVEQASDEKKKVPVYHGTERYARQLLLAEWDQEKLAKSTVIVAGMGALGSIIAVDLVLTGIGKVVIIDFDTIELSNLSRQYLYTDDDVGKPKAIVAGKRLRQMNPDVQVLALNSSIQETRHSIYEEANLIIDGLDTFEARRWLNSLCVHKNKVLIHGGMYGWWGNVQRVVPFETACLECQPLVPAERLQKACTPPGQRRKNDEPEPKFPALLSVATIIAGIQFQEALKYLLEVGKPLDNYLFYDSLHQQFTTLKLAKNPNCFLCSDRFRLEGEIYAIGRKETVAELKNRLIMTFGLQTPRIILRGRVLPDDQILGKLRLKKKEALFIIDSALAQPLKLLAVFK